MVYASYQVSPAGKLPSSAIIGPPINASAVLRALVPKLCLGIRLSKLRFASPKWKQSFRTCVPKRSLGTRNCLTPVPCPLTPDSCPLSPDPRPLPLSPPPPHPSHPTTIT